MSAAAQQAWGEYREAIEALYSRSTRELIEMEGVGIAGEPSDEAIETALEGSDALSGAIQSDLDSAGAEQRELAILQLSAAAVVDLSVAHDLALNAGAEEAQPEFEATEWAVEGVEAPPPGEPALTDELAVVGPILDVEPGAGIWAAISAGGAPAEPGNYRENLEKAVDAALDGICGDAAKVGTKTFHGLLTLPGVDLAQVAGSGVASVFDGIDSESDRYLLRRAARFVLKGLEKILSVFGTNTQAVFKKVVAWAEGLGEDGIRTFLERIYGMKGAQERLHASIKASASEEKMDAAKVSLEGLETKFGKQMSIIGKLVWLVDKIRAWLWAAAPPWSQLGVSLGYLSATAYVVSAGGDYVDWGEPDGGWMNLVPGVEGIVEEAVA